MSDEEEEYVCTPPELKKASQQTTVSLIPELSKERYRKVYKKFDIWRKSKKAPITENVLIAYLTELGTTMLPPTLCSVHSILKSTIKLYDNVNIAKFNTLIAFLKRRSAGYQPKKAKILTNDQIETFLNTASDKNHLATKVALIVAMLGALRIDEMVNISIEHIKDHNGLFLVSIPKTKNKLPKSFTIHDPYYQIVQKYINLRPVNVKTDRLFLQCQNNKCSNQPIGKNNLAKMPSRIAECLELPEPQLYTGHSFQRTSASLLANAGADISTIKRHGSWKSSTIAENYIENSVNYKNKTGNLITSNITTAQEENTRSSMPKSTVANNSEKILSQADTTTSNHF